MHGYYLIETQSSVTERTLSLRSVQDMALLSDRYQQPYICREIYEKLLHFLKNCNCAH